MAVKASVVVPVYNKAPFLVECFESIFAQTFTDFEVIVVDDASTDNGLALLRAMKDPRLLVLSNAENSGPGVAAQKAMDRALGEYILRVDADDVLMPDRFEKQIAFMDADPLIGVSGTGIRILGGDEIIQRPTEHEQCKVQLLFGVAVMQPTCIYRRALLVEHGIRYKDEWPWYGEDWMFQVDAIQHMRFGNLHDAKVLYRRGEQGISHGRDRSLDLPELLRYVFHELDWPAPSEKEIELHMTALNVFKTKPDRTTIKQFHSWLEKLRSINGRLGTFQEQALNQSLDQAWDHYFYLLANFSLNSAIAYFRAGGRLNAERAYYAFQQIMKGPNKVKDQLP